MSRACVVSSKEAPICQTTLFTGRLSLRRPSPANPEQSLKISRRLMQAVVGATLAFGNSACTRQPIATHATAVDATRPQTHNREPTMQSAAEAAATSINNNKLAAAAAVSTSEAAASIRDAPPPHPPSASAAVVISSTSYLGIVRVFIAVVRQDPTTVEPRGVKATSE